MAGSLMVTGSQPVTEDYTRVGGFIAGCGEASLLVLLHATKGTPTDPNTLGQVIRAAASRGWVKPDGVSTPSGLTSLANSYGVGLSSGDWSSMLDNYAGQRPIIVGISNASAFGGRDAGVNGHYVAVVGKTPGGDFVVSDPNQSSKFGKFDVYSKAQFAAARPFWAAVPTNYNGSSTTLDASNLQANAGGIPNPLDPSSWLDALRKQFGTLFAWFSDPLRILKLIGGAGVILIASALTVAALMASKAPEALEVAGAASGQPELIAAGRGARAAKQGKHASAAQHVRTGAKAAQTRQKAQAKARAAKAPKPAKQPKPPKESKAPKEPEEEPVYYGGKRVGTSRGGVVTMDQTKGE